MLLASANVLFVYLTTVANKQRAYFAVSSKYKQATVYQEA